MVWADLWEEVDGDEYLTAAAAVAAYQPLDPDLTEIAALSNVAGDVLYTDATPAWNRLAKGSDGQVLTLSSGLPSWAAASSGLAAATQAEMETGTSVLVASTPGRQHFHFGHPKCWLRCDAAGNLVGTAYNITSIADTGTGIVDVTIATDFSDGNWTPVVCGHGNSNNVDTMVDAATPPAAGTCRIRNVNGGTSAATDASAYSLVGLGDQA